MQGGQINQRRVPQVGADHDRAGKGIAHIEGFHVAAGGEIFTFLQVAIGGRVELAVDERNLATAQQGGGIKELDGIAFLDESGDDRHLASLPGQADQARIVGAHGGGKDLRPDQVSGQGQFRKDQDIDPGGPGPFDHLTVLVLVGVQVAECAVDLGDADLQDIAFRHVFSPAIPLHGVAGKSLRYTCYFHPLHTGRGAQNWRPGLSAAWYLGSAMQAKVIRTHARGR